VIGISLIVVSIAALRALLAASNPPLLNGNPISIVNLHRQLTSPLEVLGSTIGDAPLAMKVIFNGHDEGTVQFDIQSRTTSLNTEIKPVDPEEASLDGSRRERSEENSQDEMSAEEAFIFLGMQQRRQSITNSSRIESPEPLISRRYSSNFSERTDYHT
jgi:hypothetical protein